MPPKAAEPVDVFIVEDQPALLKALIKGLSAYSELKIVGNAQSGEEALADLIRHPCQLLLLDLELPGKNGIEVTEVVKRRSPDVEVLILTSFEDEQKVYDAINAGASGYLVKREGSEKIREAIHDVMAGGTVLDARISRKFWAFFQSVSAKTSTQLSNPWHLDEGERELIGYVAKGLTNAELGRATQTPCRSIKSQLSRIYRKMNVHSHVEAVVLALRTGLIEL